MDKRRQSRISRDEPVTVTVLGADAMRHDARFSARTRNLSGRGLVLDMPHPPPIGAALKIQVADTILLGEVVYCQPQGDSYKVGVELDQVVNDIANLAETLHEFGEVAGPAPPSQTQPVHALEKADRQHRYTQQHQQPRRTLR